MKKQLFKALVRLNRAILPRLSKKDPLTFTKFERLIAGYKYYVLINSMD